MELDLKQCPFCGAFNTIIHMEHSGTWIECLHCGAQGPFTYGDMNAVKAWNTRVAELCGVMAAEKGETMITDKQRREVAAKLRAEAESWRCYRGEDNAFCMNDYEFTEAVLEDFGFDDMDMPAYEVFDQMADIVDPKGLRDND